MHGVFLSFFSHSRVRRGWQEARLPSLKPEVTQTVDVFFFMSQLMTQKSDSHSKLTLGHLPDFVEPKCSVFTRFLGFFF